jgi:hypothetical protein
VRRPLKGCGSVVQQVKTISTSLDSAYGEDIILRQTETTRLVFKPEIVRNPNDEEACVRGTFVFQKKGKLGSWEDQKRSDLRSLTASEGIKLELKAQEVLTLVKSLQIYYAVYDQHSIVSGQKEFTVLDLEEDASALQVFLDNEEHIREILDRDGGKALPTILKTIAHVDVSQSTLEYLSALNPDELNNVTSLLDMTKLCKALNVWNENADNGDEAFWQKFFSENPWVISQIFTSPVVIMEDQAYVGGKGVEDTGGKMVDFIYRNSLTDNIVLVEIKTPNTKLIDVKYRQGVYAVSRELSGAVNQVLTYKDSIQKEFHVLSSKSGTRFCSFNPRCALVVGDTKSLDDKDKKASFELFRAELKDVDIITFDELFAKTEFLLRLLKGTENTYEQRDKRVS